MPMPEHRDWKALKTKYGVPTGAVKGINVGKLLDDYWNAKDMKCLRCFCGARFPHDRGAGRG